MCIVNNKATVCFEVFEFALSVNRMRVSNGRWWEHQYYFPITTMPTIHITPFGMSNVIKSNIIIICACVLLSECAIQKRVLSVCYGYHIRVVCSLQCDFAVLDLVRKYCMWRLYILYIQVLFLGAIGSLFRISCELILFCWYCCSSNRVLLTFSCSK